LTGSQASHRIVRDDGIDDAVTRLRFASYDEAYDELERFYGDLCCSDDRIEYLIQAIQPPEQEP
jgi:hypothetical protein